MTGYGEKWLDIGMGWLVRYTYEDHWLDFRAYEVISVETAPNPGRKSFWAKGQGSALSHDVDECQPTYTGYVKWDGCCEIDLGKPHFCGAEDVAELGQLMAELHKLCLQLPAVDRDLAGYDEPPPPSSNGEEGKR